MVLTHLAVFFYSDPIVILSVELDCCITLIISV